MVRQTLWLLATLFTLSVQAQTTNPKSYSSAQQLQKIIRDRLPDESSKEISPADVRAVNQAISDRIFYMAESMGPGINVRDLGAKPNGDPAVNTAAFNKAADSSAKMTPNVSIFAFGGEFPVYLDQIDFKNLSNVNIIGDGATLKFVGTGTDAIRLTNCKQVRITGFTFKNNITVPSGNGVRLNNSALCDVIQNSFLGWANAVYTNTAASLTIPGSNRTTNNTIDLCKKGVVYEDFAEYGTISSNDIYRCSEVGIRVTAGNVKTVLNTVADSKGGIEYVGFDGTAGNSDHALVGFNTTNHCWEYGLKIQNTSYSMSVVGHEAWATIGLNGVNGGFAGYDQTVGLALLNVENVHVTGGTFAHNRANVGADGYINCTFTGVGFKSDPTRTQSFFKEYGSNQTTTNINAQNAFIGNTFDGLLTDGRAAMFDFRGDGTSQAYKLVGNTSSTLSNTRVLSGSALSFFSHTGEQEQLVLQSNFTGTAEISPVLFQRAFSLYYDQLTTGATKSVLFRAGTVTSVTPFASVSATGSGNMVTFSGRGEFTATPNGLNSWILSATPALQFVNTQVLQNGWTALAGVSQPRYWMDAEGSLHLQGLIKGGAAGSVMFTLPAECNCRPSATKFLPVNGSEKPAYVQIAPNGTVTLSGAISTHDANTWYSFDGVSYRPF